MKAAVVDESPGEKIFSIAFAICEDSDFFRCIFPPLSGVLASCEQDYYDITVLTTFY